MLSIEITRECPLTCPGCYAYGDTHLGGGVTLSELRDLRGDQLVEGVLGLVRKHKPLHVSLVGGEPMVRHRELDRILPVLAEMEIFTLLVTSGSKVTMVKANGLMLAEEDAMAAPGVPKPLYAILTPIELASKFIFRPITLAVERRATVAVDRWSPGVHRQPCS